MEEDIKCFLKELDDPLRHGAKAGSETLVPASREWLLGADMRSGHRGVSLRSARPEAKLYLSHKFYVFYVYVVVHGLISCYSCATIIDIS